MSNGWAGLELEIDLSSGKVNRVGADRDIYTAYLGGRGVGAKAAWDKISPKVEPLSPDNLLIMNNGALTGTLCPGANRIAITTRSPQNNLQTYSSMGGFFGPELRFAGYDCLTVGGRSAEPVYVWINNDRVEIRDARHLWGKDTFETQALIRGELGCKDAQVMCIGLAGENKAICGTIEHGTGASVSRGGVAAVMGDKRLKAIAVRGDKEVSIARPAEFGRLCDEMLQAAGKLKEFHDNYAYTHIANLSRFFFAGNPRAAHMTRELGDMLDAFLRKYRTKRPGCFNCQATCRSTVRLPNDVVAHGKCGAYHQMWIAFKLDNFVDAWRAYAVIERLGMDIHAAASLGRFAIELYQSGIITAADTGGLHLEFGNIEVACALFEKIARRDGIGDVLAKGIYEAAREIGRGAEQFAHHVKKLELGEGFLHHIPYVAYASAFSGRGDTSRAISYVPHHLFKKTEEVRAEYVNTRFWGYPDEWKSFAKEDTETVWPDADKMSKMMSWDRDEVSLADCSGVCTYWTCRRPYSPIKAKYLARLVACATGIDVDLPEVFRIMQRSGAIFRAYNVLLGVRRKDDAPPEHVFHQPDGGLPPLDRKMFDGVVSAYYVRRGWNEDGVPTPETLQGLGLDDVGEELTRRGVYG